MTQKVSTKIGIPSVDKPWSKFYNKASIDKSLPDCTMYEYIWEKKPKVKNNLQ